MREIYAPRSKRQPECARPGRPGRSNVHLSQGHLISTAMSGGGSGCARARADSKIRDLLLTSLPGYIPVPVILRPRNWPRLPVLLVALLTVGCLAPFINKAVHMDDPLFIWAGRWMAEHPADFYGARVNWYGSEETMAEVNNNPPLAACFLAVIASLFGWSEVSMHLGFLVGPLAVALGIFRLGKSFCDRPLIAAVVAILTPVFMLSGTTLMCDELMLAFWVWALICWRKGLEGKRFWLLVGGILAGLCVLTKFSGVMLVPLFLGYGLWKTHELQRDNSAPAQHAVGATGENAAKPNTGAPGRGKTLHYLALCACAFIPLGFLAGYEWVTSKMYGQGLFQVASIFSSAFRPWMASQLLEKLITGTIFTGGCLIIILLLTPLLWPRRVLLTWSMVGLAFVSYFAIHKRVGAFSLSDGESLRWGLIVQSTLFAIAGLQVLTLAVLDWWKNRKADAALLACWSVGVFVFSTIFNWTINGRSLLPMVPAVGILAARRLASMAQSPSGAARGELPGLDWRLGLPLAVALALSVSVAWADYDWANSVRRTAKNLGGEYLGTDGKLRAANGKLWFEGHWGFQYYMQEAGAKALDHNRCSLQPNDRVIIPSINSYQPFIPHELLTLEKQERGVRRWLVTMSPKMCAGFYSDLFGALPFAFGWDESDEYFVLTPVRPLEISKGAVLPDSTSAPHAEQENIAGIIATYETRLATNPRDATAHYELGAFLMDHGRFADAEQHLLEVLRLNPADAHAHERLGLLAEHRKQTREAIEHYREALRLNNALPLALNNLAWILATHPDGNLRDGAEAVRLARRACTFTGGSAIYLGTLAAAYAEAGRFDEAIKTAEQARNLASAGGQPAVAEKNEKLLELYRQGKPYRE